MLILDEYIDTWNYTFVIVFAIAICIGAYLAYRNIKKTEIKSRREKRSNIENNDKEKPINM